jgi:hypothetical protein
MLAMLGTNRRAQRFGKNGSLNFQLSFGGNHIEKSDYQRSSAEADCGALYFFKLDSGGVSVMSGVYGLIVPTG